MKKALIIGVTGQDGAYLAHALLLKGWLVIGSSRDHYNSNLTNLKILNVDKEVMLININPSDFRSVFQAISTVNPNVVINLSGQTSVALSFDQPVEAIESIATATLNILESLRITNNGIRFINIGSSECFGESEQPATEQTPFAPVSPYAVAKSSAAWHVRAYRLAYGIWASTAIMSNHESPLRGQQFITQKLVRAAKAAKVDSSIKAKVGDLSVIRDWGWAPDYMDALVLIAESDDADDYIVAKGISHSLSELADYIFSSLGLNYKNHLIEDKGLFRPLELKKTFLDPSKIKRVLHWEAKHSLIEIANNLVSGDYFTTS